MGDILEAIKNAMNSSDRETQIHISNEIKKCLHDNGPFSSEPVDCIIWVPIESISANDYNPNSVAPPEMKLLAHSISADGYTQPIVTYHRDGGREIVDGFHRNRVAREFKGVRDRVDGFLPVTTIRADREDRENRIASTIRHNRARGKHKIESMSDIVMELSRRNWSDERIAKEIGMDNDEVLRLRQITSLSDMFSDRDFSEAWE